MKHILLTMSVGGNTSVVKEQLLDIESTLGDLSGYIYRHVDFDEVTEDGIRDKLNDYIEGGLEGSVIVFSNKIEPIVYMSTLREMCEKHNVEFVFGSIVLYSERIDDKVTVRETTYKKRIEMIQPKFTIRYGSGVSDVMNIYINEETVDHVLNDVFFDKFEKLYVTYEAAGLVRMWLDKRLQGIEFRVSEEIK